MTSLNLTVGNMSVYAGFPTRRHETFYNRVLFKAIEMLSAHLSLVYTPPPATGDPSTVTSADIT